MADRGSKIAACTGLLILLSCIASCVRPTPYTALDGRFGYDSFRITDDVFAVSFAGNSQTPLSMVDRYVLRKASEVNLENGFTHFVLLRVEDRTIQGVHTDGPAMGTAQTSYYSATSTTHAFRMPAKSIQIRCFRDPPPDMGSPIDAAAFLRYNFSGKEPISP